MTPEVASTINEALNTVVVAVVSLLGIVASYYIKKAGGVLIDKMGHLADVKETEALDRRKQFAVNALNGVIAAAVAQVNQLITKKRGPDGRLLMEEASRLKTIACKKVMEHLTPENRALVVQYFGGGIDQVLDYVGRRIEAEVYWQKPLKVEQLPTAPNTEGGANAGTQTG